MTEKKTIELHEKAQDSTHVEVAPSRPQREGSSPDSANSSRLESDPNKSSYSSYLFGSSGSADRPAWSDSAQGRFAIRVISRGLVGGLFFTAGGLIARKQLAGYESFKPLEKFRVFTQRTMVNGVEQVQRGNVLQYIAKGWDLSVGRALEGVTHFITPGDAATKAAAAWEVTNFRTKTFNGSPNDPATHTDKWGFTHYLNGRSLGAEVVTVTFDFFMMSIGDAMTRNMIQAFDPNLKQPWLLDSEGHATTRDKGHFDFGKWTQALGRSSWRVISKNAGEDWAAALPYVYQMKWQRQALAKWFPGFKLSSDHGWNGGLATVAMQDDPARGLKKGQISGGYQIPGLLDLQVRFTGYNWYTLMYREMYDAIGRGFDKMKHGELRVGLPQHVNPLTYPIDCLGFGARYVTKSFIKANLYMQPAVIPFWLFRTPQSKWRGGFAADHLATAPDGQRGSALLTLHPHGAAAGGTETDPIFLENISGDIYPRAKLINDARRPDEVFFGIGQSLKRSELGEDYQHIFNVKHPYKGGVKRNFMDHILNPFGKLCYKSGTELTRLVDRIAPEGDMFSRMLHGNLATRELRIEREKFLRNYVDAAYAYTPYMWLKAETGLRVDDRRSVEELGHMDKAIYRLIDNTFSFKFGEAKAAAGDIWTLARNFEKDVKSREGVGNGQQPVGDGTVVPRPAEVPTSRAADAREPTKKIDTATVAHHGTQHEPVSLDRATGKEGEGQRQWAETVAGRKLDAQYQSGQPTLH